MGRLLLAAMLLSIPCAAVASPTTCGVVQTSFDRERAYADVITAVVAMRREHLDRSVRSDREFVGAVVANGSGEYWASVGSGCAGQNTVTFAVQVPSDTQVAAFWHTHGAPAPAREFFSPDDVDLVRNTGRDFYLITPRGELRVLRPHDVARIGSSRLGRASPSRASVGHAVRFDEGIGARVTMRLDALPTESRGDVPLG